MYLLNYLIFKQQILLDEQLKLPDNEYVCHILDVYLYLIMKRRMLNVNFYYEKKVERNGRAINNLVSGLLEWIAD